MSNLNERVDELERRVRELEDNVGTPNPLAPIPQYPINPPIPVNSCGVCGLVFDGVMGYVCSNLNCPGRIICGGGQRW